MQSIKIKQGLGLYRQKCCNRFVPVGQKRIDIQSKKALRKINEIFFLQARNPGLFFIFTAFAYTLMNYMIFFSG